MQNIFFGSEAFPQLKTFLQNPAFSQVLVLADENIFRDCYPLIKPFLPEHKVLQIPAGERHKTLSVCEKIWDKLTAENFDRWGLVVNLGGGVICDMGGFCASVYKRGIPFINIPTTLLAQVDASVGGKTGIDFSGFKNQLGVFQEPKAVFINPVFLETLPLHQLKSGYAEMVKHWLIADADAFEAQRYIGLAAANWEDLIPASVEIKNRIVTQDPTEKGTRKVLNFGHTVGHAVESYFMTQPGRELLHGEAIAVGMFCESFISGKKELLNSKELSRIETFLTSVFDKVKLTPEDISGILPYCLQDKKNRNATINCTLLNGIGNAVYDQPVSLSEIEMALRNYQLM